MSTRIVLFNIKAYIEHVFLAKSKKNFHYHTYEHTVRLVNELKRIPGYRKLIENDKFKIEIAGWFYDISQLEYFEYGDRAVDTVRELLIAGGVEGPFIESVMLLLQPPKELATPASPLNSLLSEANCFYWFNKSFSIWSEALRKDTEVMECRQISVSEWLKQVMVNMQTFAFVDPLSGTQKRRLKKNLKKLEEQVSVMDHHYKILSDHQGGHRLTSDNNDKRDKGIETMFRISSSNNQRLTSLGDNKAHILITVNSIILSAIISILLRKLSDNVFLIYPTILLLSISLFSMIFAILATRPTIPNGRFSNEDINEQTANLLFFGNFYRMSLDDYTEGMLKMMDEKKFLYRALIRDVYGQGIVLGKKYLLLRVSYNIFMFGLIVSVLAFIIVVIINHSSLEPGFINKTQTN
ncbi:Pycsar system effector family protein [Mucilaginibacter aquariorum]|uniref:DUF5706 domain-containing protein n=1 Tax=Mucilaginibacter aquariorum TaxID=2967225 RepID=A0ABT1SXB6_9SPHI|nr:Pycsar system effector family protein [Mucilaginibacter aquariorum]MCQ6957001.1 DUF5706 domain-containing protein [Mucilaginibacter aquariorum]